MLGARPERHNNQPAPKIARSTRSPTAGQPPFLPNLYLLLHYLLWPRMILRLCGEAAAKRPTPRGKSFSGGSESRGHNPRCATV